MSDRVFLLPHSAEERRLPRGASRCPWALANEPHARKFLECEGRWLPDLSSKPSNGNLRVWCEYEAPTTVVSLAPPNREYPRWLHHIDLSALQAVVSSGKTRRHLNTDPWIWDRGFVWSVCRHFTPSKNFRADVAAIEAGDIVLFGSAFNSKWVLDTVLVAAGPPIECRHAHEAAPALSPAYRACVSGPLDVHRLPLRIVMGAPYADKQHQAFSFVPAVPSTVKTSFARIDISSLVRNIRLKNGDPAKPNNGQALASGTYPGGNGPLWNDLVNATLGAGLVLGVSFEHPLKLSRWAVDKRDDHHMVETSC